MQWKCPLKKHLNTTRSSWWLDHYFSGKFWFYIGNKIYYSCIYFYLNFHLQNELRGLLLLAFMIDTSWPSPVLLLLSVLQNHSCRANSGFQILVWGYPLNWSLIWIHGKVQFFKIAYHHNAREKEKLCVKVELIFFS